MLTAAMPLWGMAAVFFCIRGRQLASCFMHGTKSRDRHDHYSVGGDIADQMRLKKRVVLVSE